ncbi:CYTH domain-containing protein [Staphylococcus kloosii]|uniref:CYTH domain-containing protein n=1 Tax=Staphylococcus kloosii TaxID=29384 RepID=UPI001E2C0F28|nr:CYTH domain-containing protein [Staphylococcus kloosii]
MATNNEIEFKQLLSAQQYNQFAQHYFPNKKPFTQTNYYIDTPDFQLKSHKSALRIRVKDGGNEMTLKVPAEVGLLEYNFDTTINPKMNYRLTLDDLPNDIEIQLKKLNIDLSSLTILGDLTTERLETPDGQDLIVLDKSTYLDTEDYEFEFEVVDYDSGLAKFNAILKNFGIAYEQPANKVQRFFDRKSQISN